VGRALPVVEQTGSCQDENAGAHRQQRGARSVGPAQRVQEGRGELAKHRGRHRDEVGSIEPVQTVRDGQRESVGQLHRLGGVLSAHPEVEVRDALARAVDAEHLTDHAELEDGALFGHEDGDGLQGHGPEYAIRGRKTTESVSPATRGGKTLSANLLP